MTDGDPPTNSDEPPVRIRLRRIGLTLPIDLGDWIDLGAPKERVVAEAAIGRLGGFAYPECPWCGGNPPQDPRLPATLVPFLDSLAVNYHYDSAEPWSEADTTSKGTARRPWRDMWVSLPQLQVTWTNSQVHGTSIVTVRLMENGLALAHLLVRIDGESSFTANHLIELEGESLLVTRPDGTTAPVASYLLQLLKNACPRVVRGRRSSTSDQRHGIVLSPSTRPGYSFLFIECAEGSPPLESSPEQLYGILEQDLTYDNVSEETVTRSVSANEGMIKAAHNFINRERRVVLFRGPAEDAVAGVTGFSPATLLVRWRRLAETLRFSSTSIDEALVNEMGPYADYMMTIEPVLVERALLMRYHDQIGEGMGLGEAQDRREIALLKQTLTNELDVYYSLGTTTYSGVGLAMRHAKEKLGIPEQLDYLTRRLELIEDAVLIYYSTKQEQLQRLLSIVFAAFGFAALAETYFLKYDQQFSSVTNLELLVLATALVAGGMYLLSFFLTGTDRHVMMRLRRRLRRH